MEVLVLDGKKYVKAAKAARDLGYATDYVGQLCRKGLVSAHLIGRTWYVNTEELTTHRVEKKRISRLKAREQAHAIIASNRAKNASQATKNRASQGVRRLAISYEHDEAPLIPEIPETRKLSISSAHYSSSPDVEEQESNSIENKGEKVIMAGDIPVVDVTDEPIETDTVVLTPRILHTRQISPEKEKQVARAAVYAAQSQLPMQKGEPEEDSVNHHTTSQTVLFSERLEQPQRSQKQEQYAESMDTAENIKSGLLYSFFTYISVAVVSFLLIILSLGSRINMTYDINKTPLFESHIVFSRENMNASLQKLGPYVLPYIHQSVVKVQGWF